MDRAASVGKPIKTMVVGESVGRFRWAGCMGTNSDEGLDQERSLEGCSRGQHRAYSNLLYISAGVTYFTLRSVPKD